MDASAAVHPAADVARAVGPVTSRRGPLRVHLAEAWIGLAVVAAAATAVLQLRLDRPGDAVAALLFLVVPVVGALVVIGEERQPIGWMYLVVGSVMLLGSAETAVLGLRLGAPEAWPTWAGSVEEMLWPLTFPLMCMSMLWFPGGHLPSARWRPVAVAQALLIGLAMTAGVLPITLPDLVAGMVPALIGLLSLACVASVPVRYRSADPQTRQRIRWVLLPVVLTAAAALALVVLGALGSAPAWLQGAAPAPLILGVPIAVGIALLRYRLFDIDLVLSRAALYLGLGALVVGVYGAALAFVDAVSATPAWLPAAVAAAAAVLVIGPAHRWGRRVADRRLFGDRDDPLRVLAAVSASAANPGTPDSNADLVAAVAGSLRLGFVALDVLAEGQVVPNRVASRGVEGAAPLVTVPLRASGEDLGALVVGARSRREPLAADELALLEAVAEQVAARLLTERMARAVQQSRTRLVQAGQEERRRLRRDLHDSLGARLTAIGYTIEAAARAAGSAGPGRGRPAPGPDVQAALAQAQAETIATVTELRRIVEGLRPAALDDLGLAAALTGTARTVLAGAGVALDTAVPAQPELDAATESALFLIGVEAVTNIARHAHATRASLSVHAEAQHVTLVVEDDGLGCPTGYARPGGVGIASMQERAGELGGTVEVATIPGGGTRVTAVLPLPKEAPGG